MRACVARRRVPGAAERVRARADASAGVPTILLVPRAPRCPRSGAPPATSGLTHAPPRRRAEADRVDRRAVRAVGARRAGRLRAPAPLPVGGAAGRRARACSIWPAARASAAAILADAAGIGGRHRHRPSGRSTTAGSTTASDKLAFAARRRARSVALRGRLVRRRGRLRDDRARRRSGARARRDRPRARARRAAGHVDAGPARLHARRPVKHNPFHVRELDRERVRRAARAAASRTSPRWGQRTITGSALSALDDGDRRRPRADVLRRARRRHAGRWPRACPRCTSSPSRPTRRCRRSPRTRRSPTAG